MKVKLKGLGEAQRSFKLYERVAIEQAKRLVVETGRNIRKNARRRAPKKTGQLRKSIVVKFNKQKTAAFVRATARYSHIVENGSMTRGIAPRPFMQPAAESEEPKYVQKLTEIFGGG